MNSGPDSPAQLRRQLGLGTATSLVVANMIGAGIFSTTGLMLDQLRSGWLVLLVWFLGGLVALAGALCYAELAAMMPRAGGEYAYLREIYGPLPAFLTGWTSFFVGFSAPIAASAVAAGEYLSAAFFPADAPLPGRQLAPRLLAVLLVLLFSAVHAAGVRFGARVQNTLTLLKVALLVGLIAAVSFSERSSAAWLDPASSFWLPGRWSGAGVALLFAMFAYSGWNAASYIAEEVTEPARNLPRSLALGTVAVMVLYLAVNLQFFALPDAAALSGQISVFSLAARQLFGAEAGLGVALLVSFALLSSLSAFILLGPRVYFAMARDGLFFRAAAQVHPVRLTPARAIAAQALCAAVMALFRLDQLLSFIGFALAIFPLLAVAGVIVLRRRQPHRERPYRTWGYPFTPIFFLLVMLAMLVLAFLGRPRESLLALLTVSAGIPGYYLLFRRS
jgi:APA family basic amino acid/polyamine antiporter